jgi:hypothetical protein
VGGGMPRGAGGGVFSDFLFKPELVVFPRPIDVDGAVPHRFERARLGFVLDS